MGLGQLIAELIRVLLPGLDEDEIADIMEDILTTPEDLPFQVDSEELSAVLEGDAVIFQERLHSALDRNSAQGRMEQEIAEQASKLRSRARAKKIQVVRTPEQPAAVAHQDVTAADVLIEHDEHWTGKGGARWTSQDRAMHIQLSSETNFIQPGLILSQH